MNVNISALAHNTEFNARRADEDGLSALDTMIGEAEALAGILRRYRDMYDECGSYEAEEELAGKGNVMTRAADNARFIISRMEQRMQEMSESGAELFGLSSILPQLIALDVKINGKED
jgi:hypothetical protein